MDGLIDTAPFTSAVSEADLNKIRLLSNEAINDTGPASNFQIMVTWSNGQLERPKRTVLLEFEVADFQFQEKFAAMKTPNSLIGLSFLLLRHSTRYHNNPILPFWSLPLRPEHTTNTRAATPLLTDTTYNLQPGETLAMSSKTPLLIDHNATGMVTPSSHTEEHESIFITSSLSTVNGNAVGYQMINFSDLPNTLPIDTHDRFPSPNPRTFQTHQTCWSINF